MSNIHLLPLPLLNQLINPPTPTPDRSPRTLRPNDRQSLDPFLLELIRHDLRIQQPHLHQHTSLIPINLFTLQHSSFDTHYTDQHDFYTSVRSRNSRQQPRNHFVVVEGEGEFVYDAVGAYCAGEQFRVQRGWRGLEEFGVEV